jgi:hypothetical protein
MIYILSYQLRTSDKDYAPLYKHIEDSIGKSAKHVLRDSWWIGTDKELNVDAECDKIRGYLGEQDSIYMIKLDRDAPINGWLPSTYWEWYRENNK